MRVPAARIHQQLLAVLRAWRMSGAHAEIDPRAFRPAGEFEVIAALHGARRADPAQPVLVAGHPETATREEPSCEGVPILDDLVAELREVAARARVPFRMADADA